MKINKFNIGQALQISLIKKFLANEVTEERTFFVLTLITGALAGVVAVSLKVMTHYLANLFHTNIEFTMTSFVAGGISILVSGYLTTRFFPSSSGSGIPGVRVALEVHHGRIPLAHTIGKFLTSVLSLSSGVSLGREGPTVAIASGIGSSLGRFFHLSKKRVKTLVAIGASGGISAAFQTPISAVVFTLEEIVGDLNSKALGPIIISSVLASVVAQYLTGETATFSQFYYKLNSHSELFYYLFLGIICAIVGPLWVKSVLFLRDKLPKIFRNHRLTVIVIAFLTMALISFVNPQALGSGHHTIETILKSFIANWEVVLILFVLKFFGTSLCYASGISGGLFMPTLLMGAILGSLFGIICQMLFPGQVINLGAFALVGMGAYFSAVIRAPFTSILMVFELTRDYHIILPLMIANVVAFVLSKKLHPGSIYESISEQDGIHLPTRDDHEILESLIVEDAMVKEVVSINGKLPIDEAVKVIKENRQMSGYPILQNGVLIGMVAKSEVLKSYARGETSRLVREIAEKRIVSIYPDQSLLVAFHKLKKYSVSRLPVVSRINDRSLIGIITAENIVCQFGYHVNSDDDKEDDEILADITP